MHNYILFISTEKTDLKINTSFMCPDDIGMHGVADYIGNEILIPMSVAGVNVREGGSVVLVRSNIENYFKKRFDDMKEKCSALTFEQFCSTDLYDIRKAIEVSFGIYVVPVTDPLNESYYAETLDSFLRETYKYFDEYKQQTFYIVAAVDYHW